MRKRLDSRDACGVLAAAKETELTRVRLHYLRHSYATFILAAGTDAESISTFPGHSKIAVAANRLAAALGDLVGQRGVTSNETFMPCLSG
jgi:integrase